MSNMKLLSWNIQGRYYRGTYTPFLKIAPYLEKYDGDIVCLQEFSNADKKIKKIKNLNNYHIYIPQHNNYNEHHHSFNHNVILSKKPIIATQELTFDQLNEKKQMDGATCADIQLNNKILRIYNCHLAIDGFGIATRLKQLQLLIKHSEKHQGPIIICGDMNTTIPVVGWRRFIISSWHQEPKNEMQVEGQYYKHAEKEIFQQYAKKCGFNETFPLNKPTWSPFYSKKLQLFKLKLDWCLRKDISFESATMGPYLSDHRPLQVLLKV